MHTTTYGGFPAAELLATMLDERADPRLVRKVSRLLQDFNAGLAHLDAVADPLYRGRLALLWRDDFLSRVALDPVVDKFVKNVIVTHAKRLLASDEG